MTLTTAVRARIIQMFNDGAEKASIMRQLKVGRKAVDRWCIEALEKEPNMADAPRSGRPPKLTAAHVKSIRRMAGPRVTATEIARRLSANGRVDVHRTTVGRVLKSGKNPLAWKPVAFVRRLSAANKAARLLFCQSTKVSPKAPWVFLDGKVLCLYSDKHGGLSFAWQRVDQPLTKGFGKLVAHYHFYAAIATGFKSSLYFVPPSCEGPRRPKSDTTFKGEHYVAVMRGLAKELAGWKPARVAYHIIRDRARQHTSAPTVEALAPLNLPIMESFPAQSWDINCIEHVWAQLARRVSQRRARTASGFMQVIREEWGAIQQSTIDKLVAGVPARIKKIRELGGSWIGAYKC